MVRFLTIAPVCDAILPNVLFPHLSGVRIEELSDDNGVVRIRARAHSNAAMCPVCGNRSTRVHAWYERKLADAPVAGRQVMIRLHVRKFICQTFGCVRQIFVEQLAGLTVRYGRRSFQLLGLLTTITFALAGRAGARLARGLAITVSSTTLLRLLRTAPESEAATPTVLGVDDFALRRGHNYGTLLIDLDGGRPIDVLADRKAETFRDWLELHPGVEIICRDRAGAYAEGARAGAPNAVQVADRWHLWHNLGEAVEKMVTRHHASLREPEAEADQPAVVADVAATPVKQSPLVVRTQERYAAIQRLLADGCSIRGIARKLDLERGTVYRFARAASLDELLTKSTSRGSLLDDFKPHLHRRWNEGCTNVARLFAEIQADGYRGGVLTVRRYLHPFRATGTAPDQVPAQLKVRDVVGWIMRAPDKLKADEQRRLQSLFDRCPELNAVSGHVRSFAGMIRELGGDRLQEWMDAVEADDLPALHSFVAGLRRDQDAVVAGLSLRWSSGPVEGHVNRLKMLKRQMFGRANLDLLRRRVLATT
ncbi:MAG TPA: ISL3 family transposase [Candidatus Dormibacteraeota bacterium]|nr:ISL3 family transposase [Candidatus Dormibacteraeota bacterium]